MADKCKVPELIDDVLDHVVGYLVDSEASDYFPYEEEAQDHCDGHIFEYVALLARWQEDGYSSEIEDRASYLKEALRRRRVERYGTPGLAGERQVGVSAD